MRVQRMRLHSVMASRVHRSRTCARVRRGHMSHDACPRAPMGGAGVSVHQSCPLENVQHFLGLVFRPSQPSQSECARFPEAAKLEENALGEHGSETATPRVSQRNDTGTH